MRLPVLTAVVDARWEAGVVAAFERGDLGVTVVRRCVDLADLLAAAAAGTARAVLLSADLRRLDRDALARLAASGVATVGLVPPGDEVAERRLRQLGLRWVLAADVAPDVVAQALAEAVSALAGDAGDLPAPGTGFAAVRVDDGPPPLDAGAGPDIVAGTGRLVAVWGPTGAPGRTTVAVNLAAELASLGVSTLLVDADPYGGVVAQCLGLLDEAPGLTAACRAANTGTLDVPGLAALAREVRPGLRVLTGIARADRWPELRAAALESVLALARSLAAVTVVDCGFCVEQDEELSYDTLAPRRNAATLTALTQAETVVAVAAADPVGLQRFVRAVADVRELVPGTDPLVVLNRIRKGVVPGDAEREMRAALARHAGLTRAFPIPYDRDAMDAAVRQGRALAECAAGSPARQAFTGLARQLAGIAGPGRRGRRRGQRSA